MFSVFTGTNVYYVCVRFLLRMRTFTLWSDLSTCKYLNGRHALTIFHELNNNETRFHLIFGFLT